MDHRMGKTTNPGRHRIRTFLYWTGALSGLATLVGQGIAAFHWLMKFI